MHCHPTLNSQFFALIFYAFVSARVANYLISYIIHSDISDFSDLAFKDIRNDIF